MRNRKMIWGAVASLCLCLASAVGSAAVASEPADVVPVSSYGAAPEATALYALPAAMVTVRAERLAVRALPADADRMRLQTAPAVTAGRAPTMTVRAIYLPPAASLRPRPGWRWSI